jgi:transposase
MPCRKPYPSDVSDEEWAFVAPYLALIREDAPQRTHDLRQIFNALRYLVRSGAPWRWLPNDLPPWEAVYQQTQRWLQAGVFEAMAHDLRTLLRLLHAREPQPSAAILDSRTLRSTPERRPRWLRWSQAQEGQQSASGGRHVGAPSGAARHSC